MANKRIFELAKELNVKSRAIVDKCHAEGIPKDVIKNHMSTISIGLEQTVREWFADEQGAEESPHTAVEESDRVDFEKVKQTKPSRARKAKPAATERDSSEGDGEDGSVATVEKTPPPPGGRVRTGGRAAPAPGEGPDQAGTETTEHGTTAAAASRSDDTTSAEGSGSATAESADDSDATPGADAGDDKGTDDQGPAPDGAEDQGAKAPPRTVARPNVPRRPKSVTPAGPRLEDEKRESVKLSGPKVVRVEAPDRVEPPRQRPAGGGRGRGPGGGPGGGPAPADPSGLPPEGRPPRAGEQWRINFSRVQWPVEVVDGCLDFARVCRVEVSLREHVVSLLAERLDLLAVLADLFAEFLAFGLGFRDRVL